MIKVNNKMLKRFIEIMENYNEVLFGNNKQIKSQLEMCLNSMGYFSGCAIRVYYNKNKNDFIVESRF